MGCQCRIELGRSLARGCLADLGCDREEDADDLVELGPSIDRRIDVREIGRELTSECDRCRQPGQRRTFRVQPQNRSLCIGTENTSERTFVMHTQAAQ